MVVVGLSEVINGVCCGAYAITKQCSDDGDLVFDSVKPTDVPRIIRMGAGSERPSYVDTMKPASRSAMKRSTFFKDVGIVQGLSNRAKRFAAGLRNSERQIRRSAVSLALHADNAAEVAEQTIDPVKRAEILGISANAATISGFLFSMLDTGEDVVLGQKALSAGACSFSRMGMPVAGATVQTSAAVMSKPWNRMDDRTRRMKKEAGRIWAQSLQVRDDEMSELDRIFLGLVSAPKNEYVRLLLVRLLEMHGRSGNWLCMSADYLRLGLAVAKSENPTHKDWFVVKTCVNRALGIWWGLHQRGEMDIEEIMPEVETAEEIALWAGTLEDIEHTEDETSQLARHYEFVIARKNDEHLLGKLATNLERERFIKQYVPHEHDFWIE